MAALVSAVLLAIGLVVWASPAQLPGKERVGASRTIVASGSATVPMLYGESDGIHAYNPGGTDNRVVVPRNNVNDPSGEWWSAADQTGDGRRILFLSGHYDQDHNYVTRLFLANADGTGVGVEPLGGRDVFGFNAAISSDGQRVAFNDGRGTDSSAPNINVINTDGTGEQTVATGYYPDWSPDGTHLVYENNDFVWIVAATPGATPVAIAPLIADPPQPGTHVTNTGPVQWSPDGTLIAFAQLHYLAKGISVVHPDGGGLRPVMTEPDVELDGWSPDSRTLAITIWPYRELPRTQVYDLLGHGLPGTSAANGVVWANTTGPMPCPDGYWLLGRDGGVFSFGTAAFHGSTGGMVLNQPVVGMTGTPTHDGYWLVASDGGIFSFGDAAFYGSTGAMTLNKPIVGIAATPTGKGYWMVASDGGIFSFGDAAFFGSTGSIQLNSPIIGIAASPTGNGYLLAAGDGGTFDFGDARFPGSTASPGLPAPVTATAGIGSGLLLATSTGEVAALDDARWCGSLRGSPLAAPIVAAAAS
jgi:hypothetical protein